MLCVHVQKLRNVTIMKSFETLHRKPTERYNVKLRNVTIVKSFEIFTPVNIRNFTDVKLHKP